MKSGGFHHEIREIRRISPWNLVDFRWNPPPNLIKSDVWAKTLLMFQQKLFWFIRFGWISPEIRRISCEIERPLARNCNPMFKWLLLLLFVHLLFIFDRSLIICCMHSGITLVLGILYNLSRYEYRWENFMFCFPERFCCTFRRYAAISFLRVFFFLSPSRGLR